MATNENNVAPEGYTTVSPHLVVDSIEKEVHFLKNVFQAEVLEEFKPQGEVIHATVRIGDTSIMIGKSSKDFPAIQSMNYIFVVNADETYQQALKYGATSLIEPVDEFFGHRRGGFKDPQENTWWVAKFIKKVSPDEMQKMFTERRGD